MEKYKTVKITEETYNNLSSRGLFNESFDKLINRLFIARNNLQEVNNPDLVITKCFPTCEVCKKIWFNDDKSHKITCKCEICKEHTEIKNKDIPEAEKSKPLNSDIS